MLSRFNETIATPWGQGRVQSPFMVIGEAPRILVRLPVNEQTAPHLKDPNCMTPKAVKTGLWVFTEEELSGDKGKVHWVGGSAAEEVKKAVDDVSTD